MSLKALRRMSPAKVRYSWRRWRLGEMHTQISCALGTMPSKIFDLVQSRSGFSPVEPVRRVPFLKAAEREEISLGVMADLSSSMRQSALKRLRQAVRAWAALGRIRSQRVLATGLTGRNFWVK